MQRTVHDVSEDDDVRTVEDSAGYHEDSRSQRVQEPRKNTDKKLGQRTLGQDMIRRCKKRNQSEVFSKSCTP